MKNKEKKIIISEYKASVSKNIRDIEKILKEEEMYTRRVFNQYRNILRKTSGFVVGKWDKGEKYIRTEYVMRAFDTYYPAKLLELSIQVDAMINILDDLLDEEMGEEGKKTLVLEYLRVFSVYCFNKPSAQIQMDMGHYFNKLITLAIAEQRYLGAVSEENDLSTIVQLSIELLELRSRDIDIFVDIAIRGSVGLKKKNELRRSFVVFRALNILKKDIVDVEHDRKNNQATLVTSVLDREGEFELEEYVLSIIGELEIMLKNQLQRITSRDGKVRLILEKIEKMFMEDVAQTRELLTKI